MSLFRFFNFSSHCKHLGRKESRKEGRKVGRKESRKEGRKKKKAARVPPPVI
jgi:hypothetical protein